MRASIAIEPSTRPSPPLPNGNDLEPESIARGPTEWANLKTLNTDFLTSIHVAIRILPVQLIPVDHNSPILQKLRNLRRRINTIEVAASTDRCDKVTKLNKFKRPCISREINVPPFVRRIVCKSTRGSGKRACSPSNRIELKLISRLESSRREHQTSSKASTVSDKENSSFGLLRFSLAFAESIKSPAPSQNW